MIEKASGVDISPAVRMIEDAFSDNFRYCMLFTRDVDYLPAIESIRRKGKRVIVAGFENGLSRDSPLLCVPDLFVDLAHFMNYLPVAWVPREQVSVPVLHPSVRRLPQRTTMATTIRLVSRVPGKDAQVFFPLMKNLKVEEGE